MSSHSTTVSCGCEKVSRLIPEAETEALQKEVIKLRDRNKKLEDENSTLCANLILMLASVKEFTLMGLDRINKNDRN